MGQFSVTIYGATGSVLSDNQQIFPNEAAVTRLVGALMLEQNDEWAITRRYMTLETVAAICDTTPMDPATIAAL